MAKQFFLSAAELNRIQDQFVEQYTRALPPGLEEEMKMTVDLTMSEILMARFQSFNWTCLSKDEIKIDLPNAPVLMSGTPDTFHVFFHSSVGNKTCLVKEPAASISMQCMMHAGYTLQLSNFALQSSGLGDYVDQLMKNDPAYSLGGGGGGGGWMHWLPTKSSPITLPKAAYLIKSVIDEEPPEPAPKKASISHFPHRCPKCGAAAFIGFSAVDCSANCSK